MFYHPQSGVVYNFSHVCMYICQTITLQSLEVGNFYTCTSGVSVGITGLVHKRRSQEQKSGQSLFPQCDTSISQKSGSVRGTAMKFACNMGFLTMTDRTVYLPSIT